MGGRPPPPGEGRRRGGGGAGGVECGLDVDSEESVAAAAAWVQAQLGRCDALVNNAAIDYETDARATTADLARVRRAMDTNLFGAWRVALAFLPLLRRSPHPRLVDVSGGGGPVSAMGARAPPGRGPEGALDARARGPP